MALPPAGPQPALFPRFIFGLRMSLVKVGLESLK